MLVALGVLAMAAAGAAWACGPARPPNVVLVTVDTLRADHLAPHGHARDTAPGLRRMADEGVRFEHALSQAPWTLPSIASAHTSLYPIQHGAVRAETPLPEEARTLAEVLQERGYRTVGIVSHEFVDSRHGLAQGFEIFDESNVGDHEAVSSESLTETALDRVAEIRRDGGTAPEDAPFFLWIHYFDPHFSYVRHPDYGFADGYDGFLPGDRLTSPGINQAAPRIQRRIEAGSREDLDYVKAVYDEEIAHTDHWIDDLRRRLGAMYAAEPTLWIVTSDHGEYFLERGRFFHGKDVYEPLVHVPLIIAGAVEEGLRGVSVEQSVEVRDVPATIMGLLGTEEHPFAGEDLLELARGEGGEPAPAFTQGLYAFGTDLRKHAVVHRGWKLIHDLDEDRYELYHLPTDPQELDDRWNAGEPADPVAMPLKGLLDEFALLPGMEPTTLEISEEELERLESLGYIR